MQAETKKNALAGCSFNESVGLDPTVTRMHQNCTRIFHFQTKICTQQILEGGWAPSLYLYTSQFNN